MADFEDPQHHSSSPSPASDNATRLFPPYLLWFVLIPALPFFFSLSTLDYFVNPTTAAQELHDKQAKAAQQHQAKPPLAKKDPKLVSKEFVMTLFASETKFINQPQKTLTHISNLLTYFSITAVHGIACLIVIGFFLYQIHKLPKILLRRCYLYMAITAAAFLTVAYIVHKDANNIMLAQLGYKSICVLLSQADLQTALVWLDSSGGHSGEACFEAKNTRLVWLAYTPILFGMLAIMAASSFTTVMASASIASADEQWRPEFLARIKRLQKSFYLLTLVLVTSTITIQQFTSLPLELLDGKIAEQPVLALKKFVDGITAFWGGLFTATLFATFTPAALLFFKHTRDHQSGPTDPANLWQWLYDSVFVSTKKQAMNVLVIIAPMLVGPLSELLRKLSGFSG